MDSKLKDKLQSILVTLFLGSLLLLGIYHMFIRSSDEIGFLGAGKVGRQVLIQTLDAEVKPDLRIDSEFNDTPLLARLIIGEPLRTTLVYDYAKPPATEPNESTLKEFLDKPQDQFTQYFQGPITMQDGYDISKEDLLKSIKEKNVMTIEDLFAGFGFKKFVVKVNGVEKVALDIRGTKNVGHVGGN